MLTLYIISINTLKSFVSWCHSLLFFPLSFLYQFPLKLTSVFVLLIHGYCSSSSTQTRMSIFFTSLPSFILTLLSAVDTQLPIALPTLRIGHPTKEPWFWPYDRQLSHSCVNISLLQSHLPIPSPKRYKDLGVSNSNQDLTHPENSSDSAWEPADSMPVMVSGGSPPLESENIGSVGGFSPQNPKKPNWTEI